MGKLILFLLGGTIINSLIIIYCCGKYRKISVQGAITLSILGTLAGTLGVKIMAFIESGSWSGLSFFGGLLFVPLFMIPIAAFIALPYLHTLDIYAPCISSILALMKVQCIICGCCYGRVLWQNAAGEAVRFPSQITEGVCAVITTVILIRLMKNEKNRGKIYPLLMVIYGGERFFLNLLRETEPAIWILPFGNFWSLVSIALGIAAIVLLDRHPELIPPEPESVNNRASGKRKNNNKKNNRKTQKK